MVPHDDPRPLVVLSRHAGPGDSLLLVHELLSQYGRRPRIVLKAALQWDPLLDLLLNRLPNRFVSAARESGAAAIGELARDLGAADAVVIFPEGANFTADRRTRGIARLEQAGRHEHAARARGLRHLLAPRPGGTLAAIDAAPHADVVFVAHSGLEDLSTLRDLWRGLPMDAVVRAPVDRRRRGRARRAGCAGGLVVRLVGAPRRVDRLRPRRSRGRDPRLAARGSRAGVLTTCRAPVSSSSAPPGVQPEAVAGLADDAVIVTPQQARRSATASSAGRPGSPRGVRLRLSFRRGRQRPTT